MALALHSYWPIKGLVFTMLVFIVMEAIIVGGYSHDLPGQAAHGLGFLPGVVDMGTLVTWPFLCSHMLSDPRPLINSYTKINLLLLAACHLSGLHWATSLSQHWHCGLTIVISGIINHQNVHQTCETLAALAGFRDMIQATFMPVMALNSTHSANFSHLDKGLQRNSEQ